MFKILLLYDHQMTFATQLTKHTCSQGACEWASTEHRTTFQLDSFFFFLFPNAKLLSIPFLSCSLNEDTFAKAGNKGFDVVLIGFHPHPEHTPSHHHNSSRPGSIFAPSANVCVSVWAGGGEGIGSRTHIMSLSKAAE